MNARTGFLAGLALGLVFSLGFAAAIVLVPRADAQAGPAVRYQYMQIEHGWDDGRWANEAGAQGWRFVGFDGADSHKLLFERAR